MQHKVADKLVYSHETIHLQNKLQDAGWEAEGVAHESDSDSDDEAALARLVGRKLLLCLRHPRHHLGALHRQGADGVLVVVGHEDNVAQAHALDRQSEHASDGRAGRHA